MLPIEHRPLATWQTPMPRGCGVGYPYRFTTCRRGKWKDPCVMGCGLQGSVTPLRTCTLPTPTMSLEDSSKQERIEEFLRKSLLGEQLINTQFHLFSATSSVPSCRLTQPRVLCANNILLAKSSKYFLDCKWFFYLNMVVAFTSGIQC